MKTICMKNSENQKSEFQIKKERKMNQNLWVLILAMEKIVESYMIPFMSVIMASMVIFGYACWCYSL